MADFIKDEDNSEACLSAVEAAIARALETIGEKAEGCALALAAPRGPKGGALSSGLTSRFGAASARNRLRVLRVVPLHSRASLLRHKK